MSSRSNLPPGFPDWWNDSAIESARRQIEQYSRLQQDQIRQVSGSAAAILEEFNNSSMATLARELEASDDLLRRQIEAAIQPLPNLIGWEFSTAARNAAAQFASQFESLNIAIRDAMLLGAFEFQTLDVDEDEPRAGDLPFEDEPRLESQDRLPSEQLIPVLPADALTRLQQVEFLPLRVLDEVVRNPRAMHQLSPRQFEKLVAEVLARLDFDNIVLTPSSGDKGRDVLATQNIAGVPVIFAFECKRYSATNKVGVATLRTLLGTVTHGPTTANVGVLVTTSSFTKGAQDFFVTEARVRGRDFDAIVEWLQQIRRQR